MGTRQSRTDPGWDDCGNEAIRQVWDMRTRIENGTMTKMDRGREANEETGLGNARYEDEERDSDENMCLRTVKI